MQVDFAQVHGRIQLFSGAHEHQRVHHVKRLRAGIAGLEAFCHQGERHVALLHRALPAAHTVGQGEHMPPAGQRAGEIPVARDLFAGPAAQRRTDLQRDGRRLFKERLRAQHPFARAGAHRHAACAGYQRAERCGRHTLRLGEHYLQPAAVFQRVRRTHLLHPCMDERVAQRAEGLVVRANLAERPLADMVRRRARPAQQIHAFPGEGLLLMLAEQPLRHARGILIQARPSVNHACATHSDRLALGNLRIADVLNEPRHRRANACGQQRKRQKPRRGGQQHRQHILRKPQRRARAAHAQRHEQHPRPAMARPYLPGEEAAAQQHRAGLHAQEAQRQHAAQHAAAQHRLRAAAGKGVLHRHVGSEGHGQRPAKGQMRQRRRQRRAHRHHAQRPGIPVELIAMGGANHRAVVQEGNARTQQRRKPQRRRLDRRAHVGNQRTGSRRQNNRRSHPLPAFPIGPQAAQQP